MGCVWNTKKQTKAFSFVSIYLNLKKHLTCGICKKNDTLLFIPNVNSMWKEEELFFFHLTKLQTNLWWYYREWQSPRGERSSWGVGSHSPRVRCPRHRGCCSRAAAAPAAVGQEQLAWGWMDTETGAGTSWLVELSRRRSRLECYSAAMVNAKVGGTVDWGGLNVSSAWKKRR